jgi:hypothetical protein
MRNISTKITGDNLSADEFNDIPTEIENIVLSTGQALTSSDLNQLGKAAGHYAAYGDFYTDSGVANAYVLTAVGSMKPPTSYVSGMRIRFKPGNANTTASTINVSTLGVKNIKKGDGSTDPSSGDIAASRDIELVYDGTSFRIFSTAASSTAATQAEQETATSTSVYVTPGRQQYHPSAAKAWVSMSGEGVIAIQASHNVTSITDSGGLGAYQVDWNVDFSSAEYAINGSIQDVNAAGDQPVIFMLANPSLNGQLAGSCKFFCLDPVSATNKDPYRVYVTAYGDQA